MSSSEEQAVDPLTTAKQEVLALQTQREALELEAEVVTSGLKVPGPNGEPPLGLKDPLIDKDGFPLAGYDIYTIRHLRHRLACIQTDHKALMKRLESALHTLHALQAAQRSTEPLQETPPPPPQQQHLETVPTTAAAVEPAAMDVAEEEPPAHVPFARVNSVMEGSPAYECGLRANDQVLSFGSVNHSNHRQLAAIVTVVRDSVDREIAVWLKRPQSDEVLKVKLVPHVWSGQGLLGCHILPV